MAVNATEANASQTNSLPAAPMSVVIPPLLVSLIATVGSLWLSIGMNLKACPLCFYQRTFAMSALGVFAIGLLTGPRHRGVLNVLALPLAVGGIGVASFHVSLELTGKLECPSGIMGVGTAPQQSLAVFALLLAVVALGVVRSIRIGDASVAATIAAIVLGLLFAAGAVTSVPPAPTPEKQPYPSAPEICRPPYHAQG